MYPKADYIFALFTGLLGSLHCVGMCGGLVSAFFLKMDSKGTVLPYFYYHFGRIMSYMLIGTAAAALGMALASTGLFGKMQGILKIIAGIVVTIMGLDMLGFLPWRLSFESIPVSSLQKMYRSAIHKKSLIGFLMGGTLNGFLPCTLVMAIAIKAASTGNPLQGGLLMLALGMGTLPSMLFVSFAFAKIGAAARGMLSRLAAVVIIIIGIKTLYEGYSYFNIMKGLANW